MKLVHIASGDLWGGAEAQVSALARATAKTAEVQVAAVLFNRGSRLGKELRDSGIAVYELDETRTSFISLWRQLLGHFRTSRPDIVHTHRFKEDILGASAAAVLNIPSLRTVHGAPEPEMMEGGIRRKILATADRWIARRLQSRVVAVSADLANKLKTLLPGASIDIIANGISPHEVIKTAAQERPVELPSTITDAVRIGFFGRLAPVKRVDLLLRVVHELSSMNQAPVELYIVGDGPKRESLSDLAAELGISSKVHFLGFQSNALALMRQLDIVMLVSDHEGLPMVLLEAMALGIPVIARAVGGIPEVLREASRAVLVDSDQPHRFAEAVRTLGIQPGRRPSGGLGSFPQEYAIEVTSRHYLALYRQILEERSH